MGDHTVMIGSKVIRSGGSAVKSPTFGRIFPNFYNDLFEAALPNSIYRPCVHFNSDPTDTPKGGRRASRTRGENRIGTHSDSAAQFGDQGDFQSCAE